MKKLTIRPDGGLKFCLRVRGHEFAFDQPDSAGGTDHGPTPVELFVSSLAACMAYYVRGYLKKHDFSLDDIELEAEWTMAEKPRRVSDISLSVKTGAELSNRHRTAMLATMERCVVHHSILHPPELSISILNPEPVAASDDAT